MKKSGIILPIIGLLWVFAIVVMYFVSHKPFDVQSAGPLILLFWRLFAVGLLLALAGGLGAGFFHPAEMHPLSRMAVQSGLGLGLLALVILVVGSTIGLPRWLLMVALPVGLILLRRSILAWLRQFKEIGNLWTESSTFPRWLAVICALLVLSPLIVALAPPLRFDALVNHLMLPQIYLSEGRISFLPSHMMSGMPQNMEMLYTWAMALGGAPAAALLGWAVGILALIGLLGFLRQRLEARSAWVGAASLLAGYTLVQLLGWAYMDTLPMLFGLGVLICLDFWRQKGGLRLVVAAGALAGLAIGSKYTAGVIFVSGLAALLWGLRARRERVLPVLLGFGIAALLLTSPWLVRNWITTGNPVFPLIFQTSSLSSIGREVYQSSAPYGNWLDVIALPLRATYLGIDSANGYMFAPGALLLALGGLFWLAWRDLPPENRPTLETAAMISISGIVLWVVVNQLSGKLIQTRYYISLFPAFATLAALGDYGLARREIPGLRPARLVNAFILLALLLNLTETGLATLRLGAGQALVGIKSQSAYLADNLGWYQPAMQAVQELPAGSRAILLYEARGFYCLPKCDQDEILDRWKTTRAENKDAAAIRQDWLNQGYTHVLFYKSGAEFLVEAKDPNHPAEDVQSLEQFLQTLPAPLDFGGVYQLYSLVE